MKNRENEVRLKRRTKDTQGEAQRACRVANWEWGTANNCIGEDQKSGTENPLKPKKVSACTNTLIRGKRVATVRPVSWMEGNRSEGTKGHGNPKRTL